jgi:signal peptidase I
LSADIAHVLDRLPPPPLAEPDAYTNPSIPFFVGPATHQRVHRNPASSLGRWTAAFCLWAVLGVGVGLLVSLSVPMLIGYRSFVVMSGSMEPAIHTGDVVVDQRMAPADVRVGDVVTYRDPDRPTQLITHRVRAVYVRGNLVDFVTQGDANNNSQRWTIPADGTVGVVRFRLVKLGYLLVRVNTPLGRFVLIFTPILLLAAFEIAAIWRKPETTKELPDVVWA